MYRWWLDLENQLQEVSGNQKFSQYQNGKTGANLQKGRGSVLSKDITCSGIIEIGENCMIGHGVILRGTVRIGDNVRLGYGVEVKDSVIRSNSTIGPLCYLGNSLVEEDVYLGALVRTSNHRLDRATVHSWNGECFEDTKREKLGAWIRSKASLGIGIIILPGPIIPADSIFEPNLVIKKNYPSGIYRNFQQIVQESI